MPYPREYFGHYQDLGMSSLKRLDYACNLILSVDSRVAFVLEL